MNVPTRAPLTGPRLCLQGMWYVHMKELAGKHHKMKGGTKRAAYDHVVQVFSSRGRFPHEILHEDWHDPWSAPAEA